MQQQHAFIIGAGVAGLAVATRLAVAGMQVQVFEANVAPGGKIGCREQDGFRFDTGPSLFTQPRLIEELFELAGENMADYLQYAPLPEACRYFFEDGTRIIAHTNPTAFAAELAEQLGEQSETVMQYLQQSARLYENTGRFFTEQPIRKATVWRKPGFFKAMRAAGWKDLFGTLDQYNQQQFRHPHTVQLFNRFATYNGSDPYRAPAMLRMIPHLEHNEGAYFPGGGMISIAHALYQLALKKGVQFHFNKPVQRIIVNEGRVRGLVVNDENHYADVVVSNADVYRTYEQLLRDPVSMKKSARRERSSSALVFYWGMKKEFPELSLHNVFFSADYKQEFRHIFSSRDFSPDPTVYVNITSKMEAGHAPAGKENWFVMVNAPIHCGQNWELLRTQTRAAVVQKLGRILGADIESLIETEACWDPQGIEADTGSAMGALYGASSNSRQAAFRRPPNTATNISGLFCCGGSVHPGGGIPLCLQSAKITATLIRNIKRRH
jgi:phytoene desaturase